MAKKLNEVSTMPQIQEAFNGWQSTITLERITQTTSDFLTQTSSDLVTFKGTVQPLKTEELRFVDEGLRSFQWLKIHVFDTRPVLENNDKIRYNGKTYIVMEQNDYRLNNYFEYHVVEDYR